MRSALACLAALVCAGTAHAQPATQTGTPGTTIETAIVLPDIADEFHGVVAEQGYIAAHFATWHIEYQTRLSQNDRDYDVIGMIKPDRSKTRLFFDITAWVGK